MLNESLYFFEQTDFSLRFARCTISETSLHIEELKEIGTTEVDSISQLAPAGAQIVCAIRPKSRQFHLSSAKIAHDYPGLAGMQKFAQLPAFVQGKPAWFAGAQASDGSPPAGNPWLIALCTAEAYQQSRKHLEAIKLKPARCLDATFATVGALTSTVASPTLLLEIGELKSQALLVGTDGVLASGGLSLNLDQIVEAVQSELGLKNRGSAAKLFFNPDCDFSKSAPNIAARLATALKADLAPLLAGQPAPTSLYCTGLPDAQGWLAIQISAALGLVPYAPDINTWSANAGVTFGGAEMTAGFTPSWFSFLHFINSQTLESSVAVAWQAELLPVVGTVTTSKPATNPPQPAAGISSAAPSPKAAVAEKSKPAPAPTPAPAPAKASSIPAAKAVQSPVPAASSVRYPPTQADQASDAKSKKPLFIGIAVLLLALFGGGFYYLQSQKAEAARITLEKQQAEQKIKAEEERARLAEAKAQQETETRRKFEFDTNQKLAQAEQARQQAEAEVRSQTATRLANARGTLIVTTRPAGATVTVGELPPQTAPASFNYIKIGKYPVTISLSHHEEVKLVLEVTENGTTESGLVELKSLTGTVSLTSEPAGANYELRPLNSFSISGDSRRSGQTPATMDDLEPGDYSVTYSQSGWPSHTDTITVVRNSTVRSSWAFPSGTLHITSSPTGASVSQDGVALGLTPLTVRRPVGSARYEVKLAYHDPVTLPGLIEEGKTLNLTAQLPESDIIYGPAELDQKPEAINPKLPTLPSNLTMVEGRVEIQMTINRDGTTADLRIVRASNPEIGRIYMAALAKWKFKPGIKNGKAVRSAVVAPFLINASR